MTCSWEDKLLLHLDGGLPPSDDLQVRRHLAGCPECSRLAEQLNTWDRTLLEGVETTFAGTSVAAAVKSALPQQPPPQAIGPASGGAGGGAAKLLIGAAVALSLATGLFFTHKRHQALSFRGKTVVLRCHSGRIRKPAVSSLTETSLVSGETLEIDGLVAVHCEDDRADTATFEGSFRVAYSPRGIRLEAGQGHIVVAPGRHLWVETGGKTISLATGRYVVSPDGAGGLSVQSEPMTDNMLQEDDPLLANEDVLLPDDEVLIQSTPPRSGSETRVGDTNPFTEGPISSFPPQAQGGN